MASTVLEKSWESLLDRHAPIHVGQFIWGERDGVRAVRVRIPAADRDMPMSQPAYDTCSRLSESGYCAHLLRHPADRPPEGAQIPSLGAIQVPETDAPMRRPQGGRPQRSSVVLPAPLGPSLK